MHMRRAREALNQLDKIVDARGEWSRAVGAVVDYSAGFMGPQGVSSNVAFKDAAMQLFDEHVAHLVDKHRAAITAALAEPL